MDLGDSMRYLIRKLKLGSSSNCFDVTSLATVREKAGFIFGCIRTLPTRRLLSESRFRSQSSVEPQKPVAYKGLQMLS